MWHVACACAGFQARGPPRSTHARDGTARAHTPTSVTGAHALGWLACLQAAIVLGGIVLGGYVDRTQKYKAVTLACLASQHAPAPQNSGHSPAF